MRRLHRSVTSIREYLLVLEKYELTATTSLKVLKSALVNFTVSCQQCAIFANYFYYCFVNMTRTFRIDNICVMLSQQTTFCGILLSQQVAEFSTDVVGIFDLKEHLKPFCTHTSVAKYGTAALEDFRTNGTLVNRGIFQHRFQVL